VTSSEKANVPGEAGVPPTSARRPALEKARPVGTAPVDTDHTCAVPLPPCAANVAV
jgi:hypothetical protein